MQYLLLKLRSIALDTAKEKVFHRSILKHLSPCLIEPILRPELQSQRHQTQRCIADIEYKGHRRDRRDYDPGRERCGHLPEQHRHYRHRNKEEHHHHIGSVAVVETVDGKRPAALKKASTAPHGI